ncbi:MAG TPA: hypothetical protein VIS99_11860 [Terrimicrobiaceae bacterium]
MEPTEIAVAVSAYLGLKDLVPRILGPTTDYLGGELRSYTEKGASNLRRIFKNAGDKLGDRLNEPGQVSPKVLKNVLEEGYFSEDELAAEYFGGVLASSRTSNSRDDRGATFIKLVSRLSVYQLRMHHVFYATVRKRHSGTPANIFQQSERKSALKTFVSFGAFVRGLDLQEGEEVATLLPHILNGLIREGLIEDDFAGGDVAHIKKSKGLDVPEDGMVMSPSALGLELFLWAYGKGNLSLSAMFDPSVEMKALPGILYPA